MKWMVRSDCPVLAAVSAVNAGAKLALALPWALFEPCAPATCARVSGCSASYASLRRSILGISQDNPSGNHYQIPETRTVQRNGTIYQQNTANIGRRPLAQPSSGVQPSISIGDASRPTLQSAQLTRRNLLSKRCSQPLSVAIGKT